MTSPLAEDASIDRICEATSRSSGSLHRSFQAEYGITPMACRKALRLDACRRDLLWAPQGTTVSAVAAKCGFFRFGYFSVYSRRMFGECPRDNLRGRYPGRSRPARR